MKLVVTQVLEATDGGTLRHLRQLVRTSNPERISLQIVCAVRRNPSVVKDLMEFARLGASIHMLPMRRSPHPILDPWCVVALRRYLLRHPCDILHLHSSKAGFIGRLAAWGLPCRVVYAPHAFAFLQGGSLGWLAKQAERVLARRTDLLLAVSEEEARLATSIGLTDSNQVTVLPNVLEAEFTDSSPSNKPILIRRPLCFGFVGELRPQKAPLLFVSAAKQLHDLGLTATFVMPNRGVLFERVVRQVAALRLQPSFTFVDTSRDLSAVYERCHVAVLPSLWEGLPYSLLEALHRGKPVLVSDAPVFRQIVGSISPELLCHTGSVEALAAGMARVLAMSSSELTTLASRGRELMSTWPNDFTWSQSMMRIYESLVERVRLERIMHPRIKAVSTRPTS
jgi:glycosyltransferase involved in cell wall biosynthesis